MPLEKLEFTTPGEVSSVEEVKMPLVVRVGVKSVPDVVARGCGPEVTNGLVALGVPFGPVAEGSGEGVESLSVSCSRAVTMESNWKSTSRTSESS